MKGWRTAFSTNNFTSTVLASLLAFLTFSFNDFIMYAFTEMTQIITTNSRDAAQKVINDVGEPVGVGVDIYAGKCKGQTAWTVFRARESEGRQCHFCYIP